MASRKRTVNGKLPRVARIARLAQKNVSWMAILAATTFGVDAAAATVHAEVRAADGGLRDLRADEDYRLIVQTYDGHRDPHRPGAKPVASMQRAVTAAELRQGVRIDLVELRDHQVTERAQAPVVVAWIERGRPDLEFDGRMARPSADALSGIARASRDGDRTHVTLV
ncbi:hypothetical protein [Pendulispora albinea]|uniref:Uncharacterized protein n=1 Tax=Pendulispora albinea TaxID=2741071 RepID=A0ABZ2LUR4_9BACT